jgi:hypothetical protein
MAIKWVEVKAQIQDDTTPETKAIAWLLIDEDFKEPADQIRGSVHDTPFGFVGATQNGAVGPFKYRDAAREHVERALGE